ncbi:hypothetical protein K456DRAFT_58010 [Colletotrichum gloeosporioides 23]|nr:hypothetical protein K456DRAFT_58010 [Colletotrichum gloeosporioides 23]KAJ0273823.1 hypothetical protein COL940_009667 [Colletotrichum noveboracense]KAJ0285724.1 hypothetical protein CBS470a_006244 [Colletotrichum nupharicola]KAJ0319891.1 hypothetical protein Brms1b_003483 [Colletotrichum noveboracense]
MPEAASNGGHKRALLIGCPVAGLKAPARDLETMKTILEVYGFSCKTVQNATRAQILDHLEDIIRATDASDAVVVYFSGHGGLVQKTGEVNAKRPVQFLIPYDFSETTTGDFRGIADVELSQYLRRTTDRTENVTLILDCCHAARMARLKATVKTIDPQVYDEVFSHIQSMLQDGTLDVGGHHERNPRLLTIAASAQTESAYEQPFGEDQRSVLTEALERALLRRDAYGNPSVACWRSVMRSVRDRIKATCPQQFPQIEGDDTRFTFSLEKASLNGALPFSFDRENGPVLEGGRLHGVEAGDTYAVLPGLDERFNSGRQIAEVTVDMVGPVKSRVILKDWNLIGHVEKHARSGMRAFPRKKIGSLPVAVRLRRASKQLNGRIDGSPFLCKAENNDTSPFATIESKDSEVELWSHESGESSLLGRWQVTGDHVDAQCVSEIVDRLESMARSRHLLSLARQVEPTSLSHQVGVQVGRVRYGQPDISGQKGGLAITEGDRIFIKLRNNGDSTVLVTIFEICAGSVMMLTSATPSGRELRPNEEYTFGELHMIFGTLQGSEVDWPKSVPKNGLRLFENIIVVVTPCRLDMDLRCLETGPGAAKGADRGARELDAPSLSEFIDNVGSNSTRDVKTQQTYVEFGMRVVSFELNHN